LPWIELPDKGRCRPYEGILGLDKSILERFEKTLPPEKARDESKHIQKLKSIVENMEKHRLENKEKAIECKYIIIRYLGKGYFTFF
jgi:hypothetical protein